MKYKNSNHIINVLLMNAILLGFSTAVIAQPIPKNNFYRNPILGGDYPDPSVIRVDKDYYMTHSSFEYYPGLLIWHSTDLIHWERIVYALYQM